MSPTIQQTLDNAEKSFESYNKLTNGVERVARGVQISEIFFIYATLGNKLPGQILESGRALGQSTYLLGRVYPDIPILSVEIDPEHEDAPVATERLKPFGNVACLFGDSRVLLPELSLKGDVVIIDGPKELRALKLSFKIIKEKQPSFIFIHDCYKGSFIRNFLDAYVPHAFFSDHPEFVSKYYKLDSSLPPDEMVRWSDINNFPTDKSYSSTYGCIPVIPGFPTNDIEIKRYIARLKQNLFRAIGLKSGQ